MNLSKTYKTNSPEETSELGKKIAEALKAGDVVVLSGELGAGKTHLAQGIARGLGVEGYVKSPTFNIIHVYDGGRLLLYHIDLYRIEGALELENLGLEEYIYGKGVSVIEWGERAEELLPDEAIRIQLGFEENNAEGERVIKIKGLAL
jgi:tRNA threonylcarbamoyladenosine biosynthesis protein TsaE